MDGMENLRLQNTSRLDRTLIEDKRKQKRVHETMSKPELIGVHLQLQ